VPAIDGSALAALAALGARGALAAVFAVAAVTKLRDRARFGETVRAFGVPAPFAGATAVVLPLVEAAVAVALLTAWAWAGAIGAFALIALFTAGIAVNLIRGRTPDCRCFGQLTTTPIGAATLVRNAALAAVAGALVAAGPARSAPGMLDALAALTGARPLVIALLLAGLAIVVAQAALQWNLLLQNGRLLRRIDHLERHTGVSGVFSAAGVQPQSAATKQLAVGTVAPAFDLTGAAGGSLSLDALRAAGHPVLLVFTEPGCPACKAFIPVVREWEERYAARLRIAVITTAAPDAAHVSGVRTALFQRGREVSDAYGISAIPAALTVRADGTVASTVMLGGDAIATLLPTLPAAKEGGSAIPIREALA
jgi:thiol-disulfide isomerase/thioredoxin